MVEIICPVTGVTLRVAHENVKKFEEAGYKRKEQTKKQVAKAQARAKKTE